MPMLAHVLRLACVAFWAVALIGCAQADVSTATMDDDTSPSADAMTMDNDATTSSDISDDSTTDTPSPDSSDMMTPPPAGPTRALPSSGGGKRSSGQHRFDISVGAPIITARRRTRSHRIELGIQPFLQIQ